MGIREREGDIYQRWREKGGLKTEDGATNQKQPGAEGS